MKNIYLDNLIRKLGLRPFDVIVARRRGVNLVDHFIVYIGYDYLQGHIFAGNLKNGARYLAQSEVEELFKEYAPTSIRRYSGSILEAEIRLNQVLARPYNLATDNCEHFANYIQTGSYRSDQSGKVAVLGFLGVLAVVAIAGLTSSK